MRGPYRVTQPGISVTVLTVMLTNQPLPLDSSGNPPRTILVQSEATGVYFRATISASLTATPTSALTATLNDILVPTGQPLPLNVQGQSRFSAISRTGGGTILNVTPVEE